MFMVVYLCQAKVSTRESTGGIIIMMDNRTTWTMRQMARYHLRIAMKNKRYEKDPGARKTEGGGWG